MKKCKLCGKFHTDSPKYCDCGSSDFEENIDVEEKTSPTENLKNVLSWIIFAVCILLSIVILFLW